jgi:NTP pyrophosphatase (non-canonical NTP hydrolase)
MSGHETFDGAFGARLGEEPPLMPLAREIREVNAANGWDTPCDYDNANEIPVKLALIHSEVSEALEAFRNGDHENFAEELADTLIRLLDLAAGLGIDMDREVTAKVETNRGRGYRHGDKRV